MNHNATTKRSVSTSTNHWSWVMGIPRYMLVFFAVWVIAIVTQPVRNVREANRITEPIARLGGFVRYSGDGSAILGSGVDGATDVVFKNARLVDEDLAAIRPALEALPNIKYVYFAESPITDDGLIHLSGLKQVEWIHFRDTLVTPEGVTRLQKLLPNCRFVTSPPDVD